jgi:hypothetical protein
MIIIWPMLLLVATVWAWRRRAAPGGRGLFWGAAWAAAGFLMSFSLVTGLSIGLFVLPFAAVLLLWVARRAPHLVEASGFLCGVAATAVLVALAASG